MHITTTNIATTSAVAPGTVLGTAYRLHTTGTRTPTPALVAGETIARGIHDIAAAATALRDPQSFVSRPVGFIRQGDAWDAVLLLLADPDGTTTMPYAIHGTVSAVAVAPGVQLDAIWDIGYAHRDSRFGTGDDAIIKRL